MEKGILSIFYHVPAVSPTILENTTTPRGKQRPHVILVPSAMSEFLLILIAPFAACRETLFPVPETAHMLNITDLVILSTTWTHH